MTQGKALALALGAGVVLYWLTRPKGFVTIEPLEPLEAGEQLRRLEIQTGLPPLPSIGFTPTEAWSGQQYTNAEVDAIIARSGLFQ